MERAVFFDRDGVILDYICDQTSGVIHPPLSPHQVKLNFSITELLNHTHQLGYLNIIISNRPDIGLKKISQSNEQAVRQKMLNQLNKQGVTVDADYYCFHHPFAKLTRFRQKCDCHKPKPGLIFQASKEHHIDLTNSWIIGDGVGDIIAGHTAGVKTILLANTLETGYLAIVQQQLGNIQPNFLAKNLKAIIKIINS